MNKKCNPGQTINPKTELHPITSKYDILKTLGQGSFGKVVKAKNKHTKEIVAIKIQQNPCNYQEFLNEILILKKISEICKNLVCIKDYGKLTNSDKCDKTDIHAQYYIVMDFIKGITLTEFINDKKITPSIFVEITIQMHTGLKLLHQYNMAHMDLKPDNIMIDPETLKVTIVDLGLACISPQCNSSGTPLYMPQEFSIDLEGRQSTDIWAFGMILLQMIIGYNNIFKYENLHNPHNIMKIFDKYKVKNKQLTDIPKIVDFIKGLLSQNRVKFFQRFK